MIGFLAQRRRTSTVAMVRVSTVAMVRVFDPQPPVAMVRVFGRAYPRLLWCVFFGFLKTLFSSDSGESLILLVTRRVYGAARCVVPEFQAVMLDVNTTASLVQSLT